MKKNDKIYYLRKSISPQKKIITNIKYELISEYIKSNMLSFEHLQNKNYKLSKYSFEKCLKISQSIDEYKYVESLLNYSISLYFNEEFEESYTNLLKAKEISKKLYEISEEISQIFFIHLRILSNLSLILLNLNNIPSSKKYFYDCISLIKEPKIKDKQIQISMLRELLYIFFRFDSLDKFHEINNQIEEEIYYNNNNKKPLSSINSNINLNVIELYYLHKSIKENNIRHWLSFINKEIKKNNNTNQYLFLLVHKMAALYCIEENINKNEIENALNSLIKSYRENFGKDIIIKNNDYNKLLFEFNNRFNTAVEYYHELIKLEKDIKLQIFDIKSDNVNNKGNKILIKLLFRNCLKKLDNLYNGQNDKKIDDIKKQIEYSMTLIQKNKINWNLLSIINIDKDIIKNINILFLNLKKIKAKNILRYYFNKYKIKTLGYINLQEKLKNKFVKIKKYLKNQLLSLGEGSTLLKFNYTSSGFAYHFYRIDRGNDDCYFYIHKSISDIKPYKKFNLDELYDITIGFETQNLMNKIKPNFFKNYKPWYFLSLWFKERTIDLYFDNDEEMNKWFEGIYYYNEFIVEKSGIRSLNYYFFTKLKLKLLYKLINTKNNLPIINQLKYYESQNQLEYQSLPFWKVLVLYNKVNQIIGE